MNAEKPNDIVIRPANIKPTFPFLFHHSIPNRFMKKRILSRLAGIAIMSLLATEMMAQTPKNPRSVLPQNFRNDKLIEYNQLATQEVTFPVFYDVEEVKFYHDDALRLDASIGYEIVRPRVQRECGNGDFEATSLSPEWSGAHGFVTAAGGVNYTGFVAGISSGLIGDPAARQTLVTRTNDSNVPTLFTTSSTASNQAVRIGNAVSGGGAELLSKTFVVTQPLISFWYALVLQDPGHPAVEQPGFRVRILDAAGNEIPGRINLGNGRDSAFADGTNPFFIRRNGLVYRDWSCATINFSGLIGRTVTVQFVTKDCTQGGHFGYAYVDNWCGTCNNPWNIRFNSASDCGNGKICFDYTLPVSGSTTGNVSIALQIFQNGSLVTTLNSGLLTSGTSYCFGIDPLALGLNPALGGFDFAAIGTFGLGAPGNLGPQFVFTAPDGRDPGLNNDYDISCGCCPGNNLITNPGFESGNTGFSSDYLYQGLISAGSIGVGYYGVVTDAQAAAVAGTWSPICPTTGRHLVVNGATGQSSLKTVWKQTINVRAGLTYKFCFDVKKLPPCAFDGKTAIRVIGQSGSLNDISGHSISVTPGACNWTRIEKTYTIPAGATTLTLAIQLDESVIGDGNDMAFDNFTLVTMQPVATSQLLFGMNPFNITGTTYNMSVNAVSPMAQGCKHFWQVEELDATYTPILGTQVVNPAAWSSLASHNFPGYVGTSLLTGTANGVFQLSRTYRIIYGRSCTCETISKRYMIVGPMASKGQAGSNIPQILESGVYDETATVGRGAVSVKEAATNQVKVFPNPTKNTVNVQVAVAGDNYQLKVFNSFGQLVKTAEIKEGQSSTEVSLSELASGNYMLHVVSEKGAMIHTERITKL
jgi:hypothetical protein